MNSLELINKLIKDYEKSKERFLHNLKKYPNDEVFTKCVKTREQELQTLHQIKTELEAWEVVKKYGVAYLKEKNYLELSLIYANCPENKNYQKIKKALEVGDAKD